MTGPARCGKGAYVEFIKEVADRRPTLGRKFCSESVSILNLLVHGTQEITAVQV